jgi:hypothetical protein
MVLLILPAGAQEYRGGISAEFGLLPKLEAEAEMEFRKIFFPESYFNRTFQGSLTYELTDRWSVGTTYSYAVITEKEERDEDLGEEAYDLNKIAVDMDYQARRFTNDLRISNRFRYQVSQADDDGSRHYIRNRIMIDYKISPAMNPYMAIEPYYRLEKKIVNNLRFYIGNEMAAFGSKIDLFYIAEVHLRPDYTTTQYIIGLKVELDFKRQ